MSRFKLTNVCAVILSALAALAISTNAVSQQVTEVVRVDGENGSANPPGQGDDWGVDAYKYLQDALERADELFDPPHNADTVEIWVAATPDGYRPDQDAANQSGTDDPNASFELRDDVHLLGGFDGSENNRTQRHTYANTSLLTGELDTTHAYHVVTAADVTEDAKINGFTISHGVADGSGGQNSDNGGAMLIDNAWPEVIECIFEFNTAASRGGAVFVSNPNLAGDEAVEFRVW